MRVAVDQAGKNGASGQVDDLVVRLLIPVGQPSTLADPGNPVALEDDSSVRDRRVQRSIDDLAKQNGPWVLCR